jgi:charged multivesicular body protein 5
MFRFFGKKKPEAPKASLDDAQKSLSTRGGAVDEKIKKMDEELLSYKQQMSKMKAGPAKQNVMKRAMQVMQRKKMYERQRDQLATQEFNIDQTKFTQDSLKDTAVMVSAMKGARDELKVAYKEMDIDEIEVGTLFFRLFSTLSIRDSPNPTYDIEIGFAR